MHISFQEMSFEDLTHKRLLCEKRYYLNGSSSKYIVVGINPATKMLSRESCGFYVEVGINGNNMKPMFLSGIDGFLNLCKSLRTFDELKFTYPNAAGNYDEMKNELPLNINKKP